MNAQAPQPDCVEGVPHPRDTGALFGQDAAERAFLEAAGSGRLHHAWLLHGPRGVGKATLAWRLARFLLSRRGQTEGGGAGLFGDAAPGEGRLMLAADDPLAARMRAGSEPRLFVLRRPVDEKTKRLRAVIPVDEVRRMKAHFALSASDGGHRVAIIDSADEMNTAAANALLKLLEEPPAGVTLLLVSHQPSRLLPTIRSRCRALRLHPLQGDDLGHALAGAGLDMPEAEPGIDVLAAGSVGDAARLILQDGAALYQQVLGLFATLPRLDRAAAVSLAQSCAARGQEHKRDLIFDLLDLLVHRMCRYAVLGAAAGEVSAQEAALFGRWCPNPTQAQAWAALTQEQGARSRHGVAVNLDATALVLDRLHAMARMPCG